MTSKATASRRPTARTQPRRISAYQLRSTDNKWVYKGQIRVASGAPIVIDGLWAIAFGNGASAGPTNDLYFLAGPGGQKNGLFGFIAAG